VANSILAEPDRVMFFRSQEENWLVAWDDVRAHVGDRMTPTDFYPLRYRIGVADRRADRRHADRLRLIGGAACDGRSPGTDAVVRG
jgi:hypothetical protein